MNWKRFITNSIFTVLVVAVAISAALITDKQLKQPQDFTAQTLDTRTFSIIRGEMSGISTNNPDDYELMVEVRFEPKNGAVFTETIKTGFHIPTDETLEHYLNFILPIRNQVGYEYARVFWQHKDGDRIYGSVEAASNVGDNWYELAGMYETYLPVIMKGTK